MAESSFHVKAIMFTVVCENQLVEQKDSALLNLECLL